MPTSSISWIMRRSEYPSLSLFSPLPSPRSTRLCCNPSPSPRQPRHVAPRHVHHCGTRRAKNYRALHHHVCFNNSTPHPASSLASRSTSHRHLLTIVFSFFENVVRIGAEKYLPTETDILRARVKTTSISETRFACGPLTCVSPPQHTRWAGLARMKRSYSFAFCPAAVLPPRRAVEGSASRLACTGSTRSTAHTSPLLP